MSLYSSDIGFLLAVSLLVSLQKTGDTSGTNLLVGCYMDSERFSVE